MILKPFWSKKLFCFYRLIILQMILNYFTDDFKLFSFRLSPFAFFLNDKYPVK